MRKRILLLPGTALTVFFIASHCFAQGVGQVKTIFSFKNEIALTDDQELKLKALFYDEQTLGDANNNTLKILGAELGKMIDEKSDMQRVKSKLEEISKIQIEVSCRNIEDSRKVEKILSSDQLVKWKDIQKRFSAQSKT